MNQGEFHFLQEPGDPTLVMLHGTGGDETDFLDFGRQLRKNVGYLSIRGKEPEHGANRWFRRFGEGVFDVDNMRMRAEELAGFVEQRLPHEARIAVGFSNGANIAAAALFLRPECFHAAALLAPMVPFEPETLPDLTGVPILMVCGENDPMVPRSSAQTLATMLQMAGADIQIHWHPGGHGLHLQEVLVTQHWLARLTPAIRSETPS